MIIPDVRILVLHFVEIVALILAIIYFKNYKNTTEKFFLYFLWYVIFTEVLAYFWGYILRINNHWVANIYIIVSFLFISWWYTKIIKSKVFKRIILINAFLFICLASYESYTQGWEENIQKTFSGGAIAVLIATVFYFYELLNSNKILNVKNSLRFWLATGTLLFSIGMIPLMFFSNEIKATHPTRMMILMILNIILYGCYSLGFIWSKPHQETSL